ncbi:RCC1 and BTB domain-containing protein [Exophiala viscosa]|uniref:RCC1 and BTB domain-containing protein n=1 Tax=Exophiala viscosa TaxID=2486360 RepID=A0AAN6I9F1_9EURO|nr:RCC1 and BTB domain-containing protein [Exophiala viscosa]KAI1620955.1 RCC1 and BTB domain-containing protein [Exophiala viscosa]
MMAQPSPQPQPNILQPSPLSGSSAYWNGISARATGSGTNTPTGSTYLMPTSPAKNALPSKDALRPKILKTTGQKPACLVNASVTYCGNEQIYAFGGFDQFTDEVYNHVLRLNLKTLNWALVDNYGDIPGVRMGHSASLYQGDKLLVYGGENEHREYLSDVVILDLKTHHWTQPDVQGPIPKGRARHAAVVYEDKLFVIGGLTGEANYILDDICYLDLKTWTWSKTWSFVQRFDHSAWIWGGRLWVLGGLGVDMERPSEIWWLDLKGSPALSGSGRQYSTMGRMTATGRQDPWLQPSRADRIDTYVANSGSVHIRSSRREKPTAPGAISSLKFVSGPHVPLQSCGTHFHVCSSGVLLDFVTPSSTIRHNECNLSSLELDSLRWQRLVEGPELFQPGYKWHYCTINEDGTKVWLLGSPAEDPAATSQDLQLSEILAVDLKRYGLLGTQDSTLSSEQNRILASERQTVHADPFTTGAGLGSDFANIFDQPPESNSLSDFTITANIEALDDDAVSETGSASQARFSLNSTSSQMFVSESSNISQPIHVHKMILQARWPHFRRLYASKMVEYQTSRLHIPEPYSVVRAFLYYLYTDSIAPHPVFCKDLTDVAGMLVMADLYDMPKLRLLCVNRLSREIDIENAAVIWERAGRTEEEWLKSRAARFCLMNWGRVVRTEAFRTLSRPKLMELCEVVDTEGRVVGGEELDDAGIDGFSVAGSSRHRRRSHRPSETADETEGDDEDGMDMN